MRAVENMELRIGQGDLYRRHLVLFTLSCGHIAPRLIHGDRLLSDMPRHLKCHRCERMAEETDED